ncbi:MAG: DNA-methyltransferase [Promethearchaeota archaeon]
MNEKKKRKNKYLAGIAQLEFKPLVDWSKETAKERYLSTRHKLEVDKIHFSDCIAGMDRMPADCVDLVIADPPFGIQFDGKGSQYNRDSDLVFDGYHEVDGKYDEFTWAWISRLPKIMKETASGYIFSGWTNLVDVLVALRKAKLEVVNHIIWKYQFGVFTRKKFVTSHYHVLLIVKNQKKYFFNKFEHYPLDVWDIPRKYRRGERKNGTKLPEAVVERCINFSSAPGDLIFDPFMGNGSTAVCARKWYRHYLGFEKNVKMKEFITENLDSVELGEDYVPLETFLPSMEELAEKYPAIRRKLKEMGKNIR